MFWPIGAVAQQTVDPGRVDERLRPEMPVPRAGAADIPDITTRETAPAEALEVTLTAVIFEGATVVPADVLDSIAAPYLHRPIPLSEVFRLAEEVTAEYRRRGFVLSRAVVGPQRIENGVLTVHVVEGFIDQTRIEGEAGGYRPYLESYLVPLGEEVTTGSELSRALLLAQDLRGASVRAILTPSADTIGAADLSLVVARRPVQAFVALDNRGSRWLGPLQIYGGLTLNDLLGGAESLSITGVATPRGDGRLRYVAGGYDQPIGGSGLLASAFASYTHTRPGDELRALGVVGESVTGGLMLQYPFLRSREANLFGRLGFTGRNSRSSNFAIDPLFRDRTRTVTGELIANRATGWGANIETRLSLTRGLDILGATVAGDSAKSRATGSGEFTRINAETTWVQSLAGGLHVLFGAAAQWTPDSLLAAEEFGIGGTQFGRGFDPSEITGDKGFAGKAELFFTSPAPGVGVAEPYVYYEGGRVQQNDPLPGEQPRTSLQSAGGGVRMNIHGWLAASLEYSKPIGRDVAARGNRDGRMFVSLSATY